MKHFSSTLALTAALMAAGSVAPAFAQDAPAIQPSPRQLQRLCDGCMFVSNVHTETREGKGSHVGTVGGAIIGGLLGNQLGGGTGKAIATVGGAVAGGAIGNKVEKKENEYTVWMVQVVNRDGSSRTIELSNGDPQLRAGDTVRERDGTLVRS